MACTVQLTAAAYADPSAQTGGRSFWKLTPVSQLTPACTQQAAVSMLSKVLQLLAPQALVV